VAPWKAPYMPAEKPIRRATPQFAPFLICKFHRQVDVRSVLVVAVRFTMEIWFSMQQQRISPLFLEDMFRLFPLTQSPRVRTATSTWQVGREGLLVSLLRT